MIVCVQTFYDKNDAGTNLRKYTGWSLAWWHNYKWATFRILLVFGPDFIAPLFHRIFPDREFAPRKMSVPSATAILSYIRLSYAAVKPDLDAAIKLGNAIRPNQMVLLLNLRDLFEYFIPTVSVFWANLFVVSLTKILLLPLLPVFNMPNFITLLFYLFLLVWLSFLLLFAHSQSVI
jgi:hypothetical protein